MKTVKIFAIALAASMAAFAGGAFAQGVQNGRAPASKPIGSKVTEATVFLQGAELTHTATATLKKGAGEIAIEGLSPNIDRNSLKVTIGDGVVVSAFEYSIDHLSSARPESAWLEMLQDSINFYKAGLDRVDIDIRINGEMQGYLETGIAKNVSGSEAGLGIDELKKTMDYYKSKSEEILNGARELEHRRRELQDAWSRVHSQYNEEAGLTNKTSGVLKLNLSASAAGTYPVIVTYFTPAAGWTPYYDINVASTDGPIRFAAKSHVSQTTGLDWQNVRLTLSTATPSGGKVAPLFSTWFLRERMVPAPMTRQAAALQNAYSYDMVAEEAALDEVVVVGYGTQRKETMTGGVDAAPEPESIYDHVTTADNAINVTYNIDLPYSIPGNGKEQNIDLATREAAAEYKYYCAPKLSSETYLIAEIADWEKLDLLSAPANITYDGTYIGETWIDASAADEKLTLTLGTDKRVSVEREAAREFSSTKAIGSSTEQTLGWRLTVRNSQTKPVFVVLKEQYPVSTDRNITVTLDERQTTPWTENKEDVGVVTWEGESRAGEVRTYMFSYTVRFPKGMKLNM